MFRNLLLLVVSVGLLRAHAPPTPLPVPPLHVEGSRIADANGATVLLRGLNMPGLEAAAPSPFDLAAQAAMTSHTFRVIQQRWNMNAVRLPVSPWLWQQSGVAYLDRVASAVDAANGEGLVVVLAAVEDARSGLAAATGLPGAGLPAFWSACASRFRSTPGVIFALFHEPLTRSIPGSATGVHRDQDWQIWRNGGTLAAGLTSAGMQALADSIRRAGASQVIAAPAFHDTLEFQGFSAAAALADVNVVYETHPSFDHGLSDEAREANFGFMVRNYPVYAGAWGVPFGRNDPACRAVPAGVAAVSDLLFQTLAYFDRRGISWTAADFQPGSLIQNFDDEQATALNGKQSCDSSSDPQAGIGQFLLLFMTGDPFGFGSLDPNLIASAANGFGAEPIVPGGILSIFGQVVGPAVTVNASLDANGRVATSLGGVQVFFDGLAAPVLSANAFQVYVQVPYELAGRTTSVMRLVYRGVESNTLAMPVAPAGPEVFVLPGTSQAAVLNQDGTVNGPANAAARDSVISLFATGCGQTDPPTATGALAQGPAPLAIRATVQLGGLPAEILYAGSAPGLVGIVQINARVPKELANTARTPVTLTVGGKTSRSGVTLWTK